MRVTVPRESAEGERRVALVPEAVRKLASKGVEVAVEQGAGDAAHIADTDFEAAGASILQPGTEAWQGEVVVKVVRPTGDEISRLQPGSVLIGFLDPLTSPETARQLASANVTAFAMEAIPRITRAQAMDALSSQATVAGYRATLIAAQDLVRFFPMLTTAAGTVPPAKVCVVGAGVAGLQAIATARRLGAVVSAYDARAAVKEQVQSLGAQFLELDLEADAEGQGGYAKELDQDTQKRQQQALADALSGFDAVITTALVPGKAAPVLVTEDAVAKMKAGSVIVDLAGAAGGNCELSQAGETVVRQGVTIAAPLNLPATMPEHASQLYARNVVALLELTVADGNLTIDYEDEVLAGACITRDGEIVHEATKAVALTGS